MAEQAMRIAKSLGKVEFLANFEEINAMLTDGYNYRNIHSKLASEGKFTMSYFTFCHYIRALNADNNRKAHLPHNHNSTGLSDKFIKSANQHFGHDANANLSDLIGDD